MSRSARPERAMLAGLALLLVAAGTLAVLAWAGGRARPHSVGCDCGECNRWLMRQQERNKWGA